MASKKLITTLAKELDFETEYEYFDYIIDSFINGQTQQVRNLFNKMSKTDKKDCYYYIELNTSYEKLLKLLLDEL